MKNKTNKSVEKLPVKKKTPVAPKRAEEKKIKVKEDKVIVFTDVSRGVVPKVKKQVKVKEVVNPITIRDEAVISSFTEKGVKGFGMTKFPKSKPKTNDISLLLQDLNNYNYSFELHSRGEGEAPLSREDFYASLSNKYNVTLK